MNFARNTSLRTKLMVNSMLTTTVALLVAGGTLTGYDVYHARVQLVQNLMTHARIVADNSTAAIQFDSDADARQTLALLRSNPEIKAAGVYHKDGRLLASYFRDA